MDSHKRTCSSRDGSALASEAAIGVPTGAGAATLLNRSWRWRGRGPPRGIPRMLRLAMSRAVIFLLIYSCCSWSAVSASSAVPAAAGIHTPSFQDYSRHPLLPNSIPTEAATATATATATDIDPEIAIELEPEPEVLLIDTRIPVFINGHWHIMSNEEHRELRRRDAMFINERDEIGDSADGAMTTEVVIDVSTVTASAGSPAAATAASRPLPSPFDGALAANFSGQSCPGFINSFLSNQTFKACYPISLLLQGSQSFFDAEKSRFDITQVLDTACAANVDMCTTYFDNLASNLTSDSNCGKDFDEGNALVVQAYHGMKAYRVIYEATCLSDADDPSSNYCFTNAVTNPTNPSNSYLYFLPLNSTLPSTAAPICGSCTRQTMQIYQAATAHRKAEIVNTYQNASKQINSECGNNFTNVSLAAVMPSDARLSVDPALSTLPFIFSLVFMAISRWIL